MKQALLLLILISVSFGLVAQSYEIDRLRKEINEHPQQDTFRVNRLNELCGISNVHIPAGEMEQFAREALQISRNLHYVTGEGYALLDLARAANFRGDKDSSLMLLTLTDSLARATNDPELQTWVLFRLSGRYGTTDIRRALSYQLEAQALAEKISNKTLLAKIQVSIGTSYESLGDNTAAMELSMKALKLGEEANCLDCQVSSWLTIGNIYSIIGDYGKSNLYYQKTLDAYKQLGYGDVSISTIITNIGENYRLTGKFPEALQQYKLSDSMNSAPENRDINESNIADVYVRMDSLFFGFQYAFSALTFTKQLNDESIEGWIDDILSRAYLKKNMPDSALYYATLGLEVAKKSGALEFMRDNSLALSNAYAFKNDFRNAYNYYQQHIIYRDSMVNAQVSNKAGLIQYDYNMAKTQAQIDALNAQKRNPRNILIASLSVLLLIVFAAVLLLHNNRQKRKANKLLHQQKQEIDAKAAELAKQKTNLELLEEIGHKITSSLSVEKIIGTAYDNVNTLMDANVFGIGIYNEGLKRIEFPSTYEEGKPLPFYSNSIDDSNRFASVCFNNNKEIILGDITAEYKNYIRNIQTPHEGEQPLSLIFIPLIAMNKKFGVLTVQSFHKYAYTDYHLYMLRNIAIYTAIALDNATSYQELKTTQTQLIQAEKMASLGELTAGIAHEIQNPLNFVNNFSDINRDLLNEMKEELIKGNSTEAIAIANDLIENEKKINHHGKRADSIVKGMLEHSKSSTGQKRPTDINILCDEYLRLAYHGLRAKDKSFNADFKTDFDKSIGKINIVPQDIGRVLLNLFNNAFYAVNEKKGQLANGFEPTTKVLTRNLNDKIEIRVEDNGNGISQNILAKVFQPFFTTKPSGQGTGLGLSLSYDIIKAHEGDIKIETKEKEGTTFIILLAAN